MRQRARELVVLGLVVAVILVISANLLWEVEGKHADVVAEEQNQAVTDISDSFWWSVVTITSTGYGDILPKSTTAKMLAALLMVLGVGFVAVPAGLVGASLLELTQRMNVERWKNENYNGYIIICGWNKAGETLLRELAAVEHDKVVIVTPSDAVPLAVTERYRVVREDFTKDAVLRHIIFRDPSWTHPCMIVLAERQGHSIGDVDARTLMTTMLAERIAKEQKGEHDGDPLYTITQMLDEDNARVLQESVLTANEVFVTGDVIGSMIANSAMAAGSGSSGVLMELFSSVGENQLFSTRIADLPRWKPAGATYRELVAALAEDTAIPIGFARSGLGRLAPVLNPTGDEFLENPADIVYYISRRRLF
jgi:voltage-gated potassium channel